MIKKIQIYIGEKRAAKQAAQERYGRIDNHIKALQAIGGGTVEAGWFESARYDNNLSAETQEKFARAQAKARGLKFDKNAKIKARKSRAGLPVAYIARIMEFGAVIQRKSKSGKSHAIRIPPRPFMRLAWSRFSQQRKQVQFKIAKQLADGKIKPDQALGQIGLYMEGCIVLSIKNGGWEPNAPSTVRRKGFNKPLIDTAQMWQTVSSKVTK